MKQINIYILIISFILVMSSVVNGQRTHTHNDTLSTSKLDSIIFIRFGVKYKRKITYNDVGRKVLELTESFDTTNSLWINNSRNSYAYDEQGHTILDLYELSDSSGWYVRYKMNYEYNSEGKQILYENYSYYPNKSYKTKRITKYDSNGNITLAFYEQTTDGEIESSYRYIYSYDNNGNEIFESYESLEEGELKFKYRKTRDYDANGNITSYTYETFKEGLWEFVQRETYTYDYSTNSGTKLTKKWKENKWGNKSRDSLLYNPNMNIIRKISEHWVDDNHWEYSSFIPFDSTLYNDKGQKIFRIEKRWSASKPKWRSVYRHYWTYNDYGEETFYAREEVSVFNPSNDSLTQWKTINKEITDYNSNNKLTSYLSENFINNEWLVREKKTINYRPNGDMSLKLFEEYKYDGTLERREFETWNFNSEGQVLNYSWESKYDTSLFYAGKVYREYDDMGNMIFAKTEEWKDGTFNNDELYEFEYDENNNLVSGLHKEWSNDEWLIHQGHLTFADSLNNRHSLLAESFTLYYNNSITETVKVESIIIEQFSLSQNYPNPFNPTTTIKYSIPNITSSHLPKGRIKEGFVTLKVYDILGSEVATLVNKKQNPGSYQVNFNASKLASGIYFYRLQSGDFVETKKLMLMK